MNELVPNIHNNSPLFHSIKIDRVYFNFPPNILFFLVHNPTSGVILTGDKTYRLTQNANNLNVTLITLLKIGPLTNVHILYTDNSEEYYYNPFSEYIIYLPHNPTKTIVHVGLNNNVSPPYQRINVSMYEYSNAPQLIDHRESTIQRTCYVEYDDHYAGFIPDGDDKTHEINPTYLKSKVSRLYLGSNMVVYFNKGKDSFALTNLTNYDLIYDFNKSINNNKFINNNFDSIEYLPLYNVSKINSVVLNKNKELDLGTYHQVYVNTLNVYPNTEVSLYDIRNIIPMTSVINNTNDIIQANITPKIKYDLMKVRSIYDNYETQILNLDIKYMSRNEYESQEKPLLKMSYKLQEGFSMNFPRCYYYFIALIIVIFLWRVKIIANNK